MTKSYPNVEFNYLYRDASNYKNYGSMVFSNPNHLEISKIEATIRISLIDGEFFIHEKINIPSLFFETKNEDDHGWHEFEMVSLTEVNPTDSRTIDDILLAFTS